MFMSELAKRITVPVTMDFMSCSSYGSGTVSKGIVKIAKDLDEPIEGRDALIVEDIIDSGNTLSYLIEILGKRKPASLRLCTLLDKPSRRVHHEVKVDYTCFQIEDLFVVGYGLDYDQRYRNPALCWRDRKRIREGDWEFESVRKTLPDVNARGFHAGRCLCDEQPAARQQQ